MKTLGRALAMAVIGLGVLVACSVSLGDPNKLDVPTPTEIVSVESNVEYYPACGNEILSMGATTWHPFKPSKTSVLPEDPLADAAAAGFGASATAGPRGGGAGAGAVAMSVPFGVLPTVAMPMVPMPDPGDDVGTLVVYKGGFAYWESQNGDLSTWLTSQRLEYTWVC